MTAHDPDQESSDEKIDELPDAEERAESQWLMARDSDPDAPAPSAEIAREHEELAQLFATLPESSDSSWHEEVLRNATAAPSPARATPVQADSATAAPQWWRHSAVRWASGGVAAAAAAVVALAVFRSGPTGTSAGPETEIALLTVAPQYTHDSRGDGDTLSKLKIVAPKGDVRVFRRTRSNEGSLIARCVPGPQVHAGCKEEATRLLFDAPITSVGTYYVVLVVGKLDIPEEATMVEFTAAAEASGITPKLSDPFERK